MVGGCERRVAIGSCSWRGGPGGKKQKLEAGLWLWKLVWKLVAECWKLENTVFYYNLYPGSSIQDPGSAFSRVSNLDPRSTIHDSRISSLSSQQSVFLKNTGPISQGRGAKGFHLLDEKNRIPVHRLRMISEHFQRISDTARRGEETHG